MKPESASRQPIVLLPACQMMLGREPYHVVGRDYAQAIRLAGAVPFVIPSAQPDELETLLAMADGVIEAFTFDGPRAKLIGGSVRYWVLDALAYFSQFTIGAHSSRSLETWWGITSHSVSPCADRCT